MGEDAFLRTGLAGISCMTAATFTNPVDVVKTRLQISGENGRARARQYNSVFSTGAEIVRHEGVRGLYKGIQASWVREGTYSSLRMGLYEPIKIFLGADDPAHTPFITKVTAGAMSGSTGSAIMNPTDVLKVRMMAAESCHRTMRWHIKDVLANRGVKGFYIGVGPTVARAALVTATQLSSYDHLKHTFLNNEIMEDGVPLHLCASLYAGFMCAVTTSPVDMIKTRLMNQPHDTKIYSGIIDCAVKIVRTEGAMALYKGFTPQWMRIGPFTVVQFLVWEKMREMCGMHGI